jgi:hypothetical protein
MMLIYGVGLWFSMIDLVFRNPLKVKHLSEIISYDVVYFVTICVLSLDIILTYKKKVPRITTCLFRAFVR